MFTFNIFIGLYILIYLRPPQLYTYIGEWCIYWGIVLENCIKLLTFYVMNFM